MFLFALAAATCVVGAWPAQSTTTGGSASTVADTSVADLPLIEVPALHDTGGTSFVVWLTGDGGWGETDKGASAEIASRGVPVVALNSLHYFLRRHEPDIAAADLARILHHYLAIWKKSRVVLVGYSMGGSVLPFMVDRLPADLRPAVNAVILLGPARAVDFEFHVTSWLGDFSHRGDHPVPPELERLRGTPVLCFCGQRDKDCICPELPPGLVEVVVLHGGHRVGSHYESVADSVMAFSLERRQVGDPSWTQIKQPRSSPPLSRLTMPSRS